MGSAEPEIDFGVVSLVKLVFIPMVLFAGIGGVMAYEQVGEGDVGVHKTWGAVTGQQLNPGAHFIIPVRDSVKHIEIRPRTYTMSDSESEGKKEDRQDAVVVQSVNGTTVRVDVTVRYRVERDQAAEFVSQWNDVQQMERRLIRPTVRSELRDEAADIQTSEIYTTEGREALTKAATRVLTEQFADEAVVLEVVQVREVDLPQRIDEALDEKEVAKQRVQVEQERIKQEEAKAEQVEIQAEADAEVIRTKGQALRDNTIVLRQRLIDAYGEGTVFVTDGDTPMIMDASNATRSKGGS